MILLVARGTLELSGVKTTYSIYNLLSNINVTIITLYLACLAHDNLKLYLE